MSNLTYLACFVTNLSLAAAFLCNEDFGAGFGWLTAAVWVCRAWRNERRAQ